MANYVYIVCISASITGALYSLGQGLLERIYLVKAIAWTIWAVAFSMLFVVSSSETRTDREMLILLARVCLLVGGLIITSYYCVRGTYMVRMLYWRYRQQHKRN